MSIRPRALKDGSTVYDVTVDLGPDPTTGKRRQERHTLPTRAEAKTYERARKAEIRAGSATPRVREQLAPYLATWLETIIAVRCEATTRAEYAWQIDKRIVPALGTVPLCDLTLPRIQRWIAELAATPAQHGGKLSRRSVEAPYRVLYMALADAVRARLLPFNPAAGVTLPRADRRPRKAAWSAAQVAQFLAMAQRDAFEPIWTLAVFTGMRRAELLGLRWADIDLAAGTAAVRQTIVARSGPATSKPPKNASSRRPIPLPPALVALLVAHRARQALHQAECLDAYDDQDLICAGPFGRPWHPSTITHRFARLAAAAGVPLNLHYTRHSYASIALAAGEGLKAVSEVLGHADPQTTVRIYQYVEPGQHRAVGAAVLDAVMSHLAHDVTGDVTSKEEEMESATPASGAPPQILARPIGFEPTTPRSGNWGGALPIPLGPRRSVQDAHEAEPVPPEESEGQACS